MFGVLTWLTYELIFFFGYGQELNFFLLARLLKGKLPFGLEDFFKKKADLICTSVTVP